MINKNDSGLIKVDISPLKEKHIKKQNKKIQEEREKIKVDISSLREKHSRQYTTDALKASKEIEEIIYDNNFISKCTKFMCERTIKTTFDEVLILWREQAKVRPYFEIKGNKTYIPNMYIEVCGVGDKKEYNKLIEVLIECSDNSIIVKLEQAHLGNFTRGINKLTNNKKDKIIEVLKSLEVGYLDYNDGDIKKEIEMFNRYDYTGDIPKVVILQGRYDNITYGNYKYIQVMNKLGFDVIVLNPCAYKSIYEIESEYIKDGEDNICSMYRLGRPDDITIKLYDLLNKKKRRKNLVNNILNKFLQ